MISTPIESPRAPHDERGPRRLPAALAAGLIGSALILSVSVDGGVPAANAAADLAATGAVAEPLSAPVPLAHPTPSPSATPAPAPITTGKVTVVGRMVKGRTVKAKTSGWSPKSADLTYQWLANGRPIAGATSKTLKIPGSLVGKRLKVAVTASAPGYETATKTSKAAAPINRVALDPRCLTRGRVICADKTARKVFQVQDGRILASFDARFGMAGLRTREGEFTIDIRNQWAYSKLYEVSMPFAQFFSGSQGVHYSADFAAHGYGVGSHGCVNLRDYEGAKKLFEWAHLGDKVVVYGADH